MIYLIAAGIGFLIVAWFIASLCLATQLVGRSAMEERLHGLGREDLARWFDENAENASVVLALLRSFLRVGVVACAVLAATSFETQLGKLGAPMVAIVVSSIALWFGTIVLARPTARYGGEWLVARTLPILRYVVPLGFLIVPIANAFDRLIRAICGVTELEREEEVEAELLRSIEDTHREGGLDERAAEMLENVVEFNSTVVGEVMTPRTEIHGIELTDDIGVIRDEIIECGHSRLPVYRDNLDDIVGVVYVKDLVPYLGTDASTFKLADILRDPKSLHEDTPVADVLAEFQRSEIHMAIVTDEYGGTAGIVTIEDVLEEIVGEIQDEHDEEDDEDPKLHLAPDGRSATLDGRFKVDDLNEELGLTIPEDDGFDTVAGFMLARLGRVPAQGDYLDTDAARFTATLATDRRIKTIRVDLIANVEGDASRSRRNGRSRPRAAS